MRVVALQYQSPLHRERRFSLRPDGLTCFNELPRVVAEAVGPVLWSLLYPASPSLDALLVLTDADPNARWRMEIKVGARRFAVERTLDPGSVVLAGEADGGRGWQPLVKGAKPVEEKLQALVSPPPSDLFASLHCAMPALKAVDDGRYDDDEEAVQIQSTQAFMETASAGPIELKEEERARLVQVWRNAVLLDVHERFRDRLISERDEAIEACSQVLDSSGELRDLSMRLARVGDVRPLSPEEERVLHDGPTRIRQLKERLDAMTADEADGPSSEAEEAGIWTDPLFLGASAVILVAIVLSFLFDRQIALINLIAAPVVVVASFRRIGEKEKWLVQRRAVEARERRRQQLREDLDRTVEQLSRLQSELGVETWTAWKTGLEERDALKRRIAKIEEGSRSARESREYQSLLHRRDQLVARERSVRKRIGDIPPAAGTTLWELEDHLSRAGSHPRMLMYGEQFCASTPLREIQRTMEFARTLDASQWLPLFDRLLKRLSVRQCGGALMEAGLLIVDAWRSDVGGDEKLERPVAEALRLALVGACVGGGASEAWGVVIATDRDAYVDIARQPELRRTYDALAERMQILQVRPAAEK